MNEFDRKKFQVYERTLGRFVDKLRQFYHDLETRIFDVKNLANNIYTAITNLKDLILELKTKSDLLLAEAQSQNHILESFRVETRNSLERNFTEQRERLKKLGGPIRSFDHMTANEMEAYIKTLPKQDLKNLRRYFPDEPQIPVLSDHFDGPKFSKPGDNTITIEKPKKKVKFFGIGRVSVEL